MAMPLIARFLHQLPTPVMRQVLNFWPCIRGTGVRVSRIASDWSELEIRLSLNWRTRNVVGTIFGGSLYASVDPFLMLMLMRRLGPDFVVWDKSASIRFKKPGRSALFATFRIEDAELQAIRDALEASPKVDRSYLIELKDRTGEVHAFIEKVIHVSPRAPAAAP
jgi:Domain of unknown function (DUF4442)